MAVFLSYAHEDIEWVEEMRRDLEDLVGAVWLDRSLTGGQVWWEEILAQIRACDLFVMVLSMSSLSSEACRSELGYALGLDRAFLAVRIDDCDLALVPEGVRRTQLVDYRTRDVATMKALAKAVLRAGAAPPLPDVLPDPPPVPGSYRDRFAALNDPHMSLDDQISIFARLKFDMEEGTNAAEARSLLRRLYERSDLSWRVRDDIAAVLDGEDAAGPRASSPPGLPNAELLPGEASLQEARAVAERRNATARDGPDEHRAVPLTKPLRTAAELHAPSAPRDEAPTAPADIHSFEGTVAGSRSRRGRWIVGIGASIVALLAAVGISLVVRGGTTGSLAFEDQFDGSLDAGWMWLDEDPDYWSLSAAPGFLQITALDPRRNVLLRSAPGEPYEVTTKLRFHPSSNFQFAGLIVTGSDETDFLQVGLAHCDLQDRCVGNGVYFDVVMGDTAENVGAKPVGNPDAVYVRLVTEGANYTAFFSEDGDTWTRIASRTWAIDDPRIGLIAHQAKAPADARFDYVTIRAH